MACYFSLVLTVLSFSLEAVGNFRIQSETTGVQDDIVSA